MTQHHRHARFHSAASKSQRTAFARDRDSILYSSAFRRLAGITEVVRAGEADVFHTRQQHTLKVAQVGKRLTEKLIKEQPEFASAYFLEAEVVEAACLAHDLGHPPFGHAGEHCLDKLVREDGDDGFEGNAQSFRIVCKLAARYSQTCGLNLTRASLSALLKYPWMHDNDDPKKSKKWNVYKPEKAEFFFAIGAPGNSKDQLEAQKTAEAEIMDWADDITYSVHDMEDFHRCAALPWNYIFTDDGRTSLVRSALANWWGAPVEGETRLGDAYDRLRSLFEAGYKDILLQPFIGTREQRVMLRSLVSTLIGRYIEDTKLSQEAVRGASFLDINHEYQDEILILKQITRSYIISNPSLIAQQKGQERILTNLYGMLKSDTGNDGQCPAYLPHRLRTYWEDDTGATSNARKICDALCSLTEGEVIKLHDRLMGSSSGSVLDPIIR